MDTTHDKDQFLQAAENFRVKLIGWNWRHCDNTRFVMEELLKKQGLGILRYPSSSTMEFL